MSDPSREQILVVEDDRPLSEALLELLEEAGLEATHAADIAGAEAALARQRFDVVLIDETLPDGSGSKLLERMRADPALRDSRQILLSGHSGLRVPEGTRVLVKPVEVDDLLSALGAAGARPTNLRD